MIAILFLLMLIAVISDSLGDAMNDLGKKMERHILQSVMVTSFLGLAYVYSLTSFDKWYDAVLVLLVGYVITRWAFFGWTYNLFRGLPVDYFGTTSIYDRIAGKIFRKLKQPMHGIIFAKIVIYIAYAGTFIFGNYNLFK